jgi:hypothetical protein
MMQLKVLKLINKVLTINARQGYLRSKLGKKIKLTILKRV